MCIGRGFGMSDTFGFEVILKFGSRIFSSTISSEYLDRILSGILDSGSNYLEKIEGFRFLFDNIAKYVSRFFVQKMNNILASSNCRRRYLSTDVGVNYFTNFVSTRSD